MHNSTGGRLRPKKLEPFTYAFHYDEGVKYDSGATSDSSETNAVIRHQQNQEGFPTSGISTTPFFDRAKHYALSKSNLAAYVYKIDRSILRQFGVKEFVVADFAIFPSVAEDQEVILVSPDFGELPLEIVIEIIQVG
jgi:hypothetical protein